MSTTTPTHVPQADAPAAAALERRRPARGSWLLASAGRRLAWAALASAVLWLLTGWAMQWL